MGIQNFKLRGYIFAFPSGALSNLLFAILFVGSLDGRQTLPSYRICEQPFLCIIVSGPEFVGWNA